MAVNGLKIYGFYAERLRMEILLKKVDNALYPIDDEGGQWLFQCKNGQVLKAKISKPRNIQFHRKYFALLNHAFESYEPTAEYRGVVIEKNFEYFREQIQIFAGYGYPVVNLKGEIRYKSKSISFGSMAPEDFEKLYSSVITVILQKVLTSYTEDDLERVVAEILSFA